MAIPVIHQPAPAPEPVPFPDVRVVSWNVEFATRTHRAARTLDEHPRLDAADIVLLQEMDERGTAEIADHLQVGYAYINASVHPQSGRNFGNAVLSPWPLSDVDVIHLPYVAPVGGQPRVALAATIDHHRGPIRAFSTHTETPVLSHRRRLMQFAAIGEAVERWPDTPVVVGGDFNTATTRSHQAVTEELTVRGLTRVSAGIGPTFRRAGRSFHLDHVFAAGFRVERAGVVEEHDASDHHPIWVELRLL